MASWTTLKQSLEKAIKEAEDLLQIQQGQPQIDYLDELIQDLNEAITEGNGVFQA